MKKDVLINVLSSQSVDGQEDNMEISVVGKLEHGGEKYTIEYTEYDGDMEGCNTTISAFNGDCVSVLREGGYASEMLLENKRRHTCLYSTPYGDLTIGIYTKKITSDMTDVGGTLEMEYTIDFGSGSPSENKMKITVSERDV